MFHQRPAVVALFAYNRPEHLRHTVEALAKNELAAETDVFVFLDGPKSESDQEASAEIQKHLAAVSGFKSLTWKAAQTNAGLAQSLVGGISEILKIYDRLIVLEDDLVTSPFFLTYMNTALALYADDLQVASIHGWTYPVTEQLPETFFLRGADCWGWATWRRAWHVFNPDGTQLLQALTDQSLLEEFDLDGAAHNIGMLRDQISGLNDSWAIRWHASAFLKGMLTLYPGRSLVQNSGTDGSGTHCHDTDHLQTRLAEQPIEIRRQSLIEDRSARSAIIRFLRSAATTSTRPPMNSSWYGSLLKWGRSLVSFR